MLEVSEFEQIYLDIFEDVIEKSFDYSTVKQMCSEWVEENLILPKSASRISGRYSYDNSPYIREIIDRMHPSDPTKQISIMKGTQCGVTTGFVVPFMMWSIVNHPSNIMFTSKDKEIARRTMRTKFDLFMQKSGFSDLIRSNNIKMGTKRTGDTDFLKEYAGGQLAVESTQNIQNFREFAAKYILLDEYDTAISSDKKEGSLRSTVEGRQNSYGELAKIAYISTPTITQTSNIYKVYLEGDQRKWHWKCPNCGSWDAVEFLKKDDNKNKFGLVWELDVKKKLIPESIRYRFPCCSHEIEYKQKNEINKKGKFFPTAEPIEPNIVSYGLNSLILGAGFVTWEKIVRDFLKACPPDGRIDIEKLKAFNYTHLGLPFEDSGEAPQIMQLMKNTRNYSRGVVPDVTCKEDGNGKIVLITLCADLGGIMNTDVQDARIDWEIVAHTSGGATYSIDHGSCGTFKRGRTKSKKEIDNDYLRKKYTYELNMKNSVWNEFSEVVQRKIPVESGGNPMYIKLTLIDTGHFTKHAYDFIKKHHTPKNWIFGVKGKEELKYRKNSSDVQLIKKSSNVSNLYIVDVEQAKDILAANMKLRIAEDGSQEVGFMNYPEPSGGKYQLKNYFEHFKSEVRKEVVENGNSVGFKWQKRNSSVENHFWDVSVYQIAAKEIFIDLLKKTDRKRFQNLTWESFVEIMLDKLSD